MKTMKWLKISIILQAVYVFFAYRQYLVLQLHGILTWMDFLH